MTRQFTGRHMLAIMIAFFGTIVAVNLTMAMFATRTFGGVVVANSYVASQRFNSWLAAARVQDGLGWQTSVASDETRRVTVAVAAGGRPMTGMMVTGFARHPLGREADVPLRFVASGAGTVRSVDPLPRGRWLVHLRVRRGAQQARLVESLS
jgi:nitrogen fixation protein FixH